MVFFSSALPTWLWPMFLPSSLVKCPVMSETAFRQKLITTPTVRVSSHEECMRHGEALNRPLICEGVALDTEKAAKLLLEDPSSYNVQCYDLPSALQSAVIMSPTEHLNATLAEALTHTHCYSGFIYSDTHQAALHKVFPHMGQKLPFATDGQPAPSQEMHFGTSFVSNFEESQISAPDHAALIVSVVYQLIGQKTFLLHERRSSRNHYLFNGAFAPFPKCAKDFYDDLDRVWVATVKPGSYLFFPFSWQHTVYTKAGMNVMTNVRVTSKQTVFGNLAPSELATMLLYRLFKDSGKANPRTADNKGFMRQAYGFYDDRQSARNIKSVLDGYWH